MKKILLALSLFPIAALAQPSNPPIVAVSSAPSGSCANGLPDEQVVSTGVLYSCQAGTWAIIGGGGGSFTALTGDASSTSTGGATTVLGLNGTLLSGLATGLLKNTTTTGVPSIASAGTDYVAPGGALGTPSSGVITNLTGTCACTANAVPAANLTGTTLASSVVTSSLTTVGTIGTGTWQGTILSPTYGGTGQNASAFSGISQWTAGALSASNTLAQNLTLSGANTLSGLNTFSNSPTGSAPGTLFSGTPTTSSLYYPVVAIDATGATAPSRSTGGTMFEMNAPSGFAGNLIWWGANGTAWVTVTNTGGGDLTAAQLNATGIAYAVTGFGITSGSGDLFWSNKTQLFAPSDGQLEILPKTATASLLQMGGTSSSFPALSQTNGSTTLSATLASSSSTYVPFQASAILIAAAQTTVSCSTSGSAIFSQPLQGSSDKKVLIHLSACLGTASYTYPTAFTNTPSVFASNNVAAGIATSVSTTAVSVTGTTSTGSLVLEDY